MIKLITYKRYPGVVPSPFRYPPTGKVGVNIDVTARTRRPDIVSLISPNGKLYKDIKNINVFAKQHNLSQSALTGVLYRKVLHHKGWTLPERRDEYLNRYKNPKWTIISPEGKEYSVVILSQFLIQMNIKHMGKRGEAIDKFGRAWHIKGEYSRYTFKNEVTNMRITNVINPSQLADTLGENRHTFLGLINGRVQKSRSGWILESVIPKGTK